MNTVHKEMHVAFGFGFIDFLKSGDNATNFWKKCGYNPDDFEFDCAPAFVMVSGVIDWKSKMISVTALGCLASTDGKRPISFAIEKEKESFLSLHLQGEQEVIDFLHRICSDYIDAALILDEKSDIDRLVSESFDDKNKIGHNSAFEMAFLASQASVLMGGDGFIYQNILGIENTLDFLDFSNVFDVLASKFINGYNCVAAKRTLVADVLSLLDSEFVVQMINTDELVKRSKKVIDRTLLSVGIDLFPDSPCIDATCTLFDNDGTMFNFAHGKFVSALAAKPLEAFHKVENAEQDASMTKVFDGKKYHGIVLPDGQTVWVREDHLSIA